MEAARLARLGVVVEPEVGHEQFAGRLSIPYITKSGVVGLRCETPGDVDKTIEAAMVCMERLLP